MRNEKILVQPEPLKMSHVEKTRTITVHTCSSTLRAFHNHMDYGTEVGV